MNSFTLLYQSTNWLFWKPQNTHTHRELINVEKTDAYSRQNTVGGCLVNPRLTVQFFFRFHITLCNDFMKRRQINPDTTIFRPLWQNYLVECESDNRLIDWRRLLSTCFQICTPASNRGLLCDKSDNFLKRQTKDQ